jgi:hypothetical protein
MVNGIVVVPHCRSEIAKEGEHDSVAVAIPDFDPAKSSLLGRANCPSYVGLSYRSGAAAHNPPPLGCIG